MYLGDFAYGAPIHVSFNTYDSNGASITLTGLAVTDIEIYKGSSMTQRASDAGYTLLDTDGIDLDATTGIHGFSVDSADNTTAGFFAPGNDYMIVVSAVTIDTRTVNFIRTFSIENRKEPGLLARSTIATLASQVSFTLTAGSVDNDAYNKCLVVIQDAASVVQKAIGVVSDYVGSTKTVTLREDPAIFTMAVGDHIAVYADRQQLTGDAYAEATDPDTGFAGLKEDIEDAVGLGSSTNEQTEQMVFGAQNELNVRVVRVLDRALQEDGVGNKNIGGTT